MSFDDLRSCRDLGEDDILEAVETRSGTKALLDHLAAIARPGDGFPRSLLVFARLATDCDWADGAVRIEIRGDASSVRIESFAEIGAGLRERLLPAVVAPVPVAEIEDVLERFPQVIAPLRARREADRIVLRPGERGSEPRKRPPAPPPPPSRIATPPAMRALPPDFAKSTRAVKHVPTPIPSFGARPALSSKPASVSLGPLDLPVVPLARASQPNEPPAREGPVPSSHEAPSSLALHEEPAAEVPPLDLRANDLRANETIDVRPSEQTGSDDRPSDQIPSANEDPVDLPVPAPKPLARLKLRRATLADVRPPSIVEIDDRPKPPASDVPAPAESASEGRAPAESASAERATGDDDEVDAGWE
jgi:hypothetical protein